MIISKKQGGCIAMEPSVHNAIVCYVSFYLHSPQIDIQLFNKHWTLGKLLIGQISSEVLLNLFCGPRATPTGHQGPGGVLCVRAVRVRVHVCVYIQLMHRDVCTRMLNSRGPHTGFCRSRSLACKRCTYRLCVLFGTIASSKKHAHKVTKQISQIS